MASRVVSTGHSKQGKAIFREDVIVNPFVPNPNAGVEIWDLWGEDDAVILPNDGSKPICPAPFPSGSGFRFKLLTLHPADTLLEDNMADSPITVDGPAMETDSPGMHTTDTVDCIYIVAGEVWLELDDGIEKLLRAGDTVIQNGTRHAWHNKGSIPCTMISCSIGAERR